MKLSDPRGLWVKIDGVTSPEDALAAAEAGVSAVGMIFAPSLRRVGLAAAERIRAVLPSSVAGFGVFDDSDPRQVGEVARILDLDGVQFPAHLVCGRFLPEDVIVLRTVRVGGAEDLLDLERLRCDAVHLDAFVQGQLGGTGKLAPWNVIEEHRPRIPFVLSGGLRPENVGEAVRRLCPAGVDVSSGVERVPGRKDPELMQEFVRRAREATGPAGGEEEGS